MQRIGIIANTYNASIAGRAIRSIAEMARAAGLEIVHTSTLHALAENHFPETTAQTPAELVARGAEAVLVLGGDGTMLNVAQRMRECDLPLMGFNIGTLGYLTSAATECDFKSALHELAANLYREEQRVMLTTCLRTKNGRQALPDALNEVVLTRRTGRLVWLECLLNNEPVATYACDGLIVATPTGSTAYALSAGGPIMMPQTPALIICPIGPHTLSSRPLVVQDTARITLRVARARGPLVVAIDGNDIPISETDELEITKNARPLRILFCGSHNPAKIFREKLGWSQTLVTQGPHAP